MNAPSVCGAYADEDECDTNNGGCDQNCNNTIGSYFCTCEEGYILKADSHNCGGLLMNLLHWDYNRVLNAHG